MSRVQLALNVDDLDQSIAFYSKLFQTAPAKVRDDYANFAIADPPLKLILFAGGEPGTLNHVGVEVDTADDVAAAIARARADGGAGPRRWTVAGPRPQVGAGSFRRAAAAAAAAPASRWGWRARRPHPGGPCACRRSSPRRSRGRWDGRRRADGDAGDDQACPAG